MSFHDWKKSGNFYYRRPVGSLGLRAGKHSLIQVGLE